jgi:tRNA 2-thiocytidine biosynthesis protein TtcA
MIQIAFNKEYKSWFVDPVLYAVKNYRLLTPDDQVCVALSGGKDSTTLLFILWYLRQYSWLKKMRLIAAHIKTFTDYDTSALRKLCDDLGIPYFEKFLRLEKDDVPNSACYLCSRLKRGALKKIMFDQGIRKIAYGHHADDVATTLFMNIFGHKRLGSFTPRIDPSTDKKMTIIRPMVYLAEKTIIDIHRRFQLPLIKSTCKYQRKNIRKDYRKILDYLESHLGIENCGRTVVEALENIDELNRWKKSGKNN